MKGSIFSALTLIFLSVIPFQHSVYSQDAPTLTSTTTRLIIYYEQTGVITEKPKWRFEKLLETRWKLDPGFVAVQPDKAWFEFRTYAGVKFGWGAVGSWYVTGDTVTIVLPKEKAPKKKPFKRNLTFNKEFTTATDEQGRQYQRMSH